MSVVRMAYQFNFLDTQLQLNTERCADIDECLSDPCLTGLFVDGENSYVCRCDPGFTGTNCDQRKI